MKKALSLLLLLFAFNFSVSAQIREFPDSLNWKKVNRLIVTESAFYVGGISFLNYIWYNDKQRVPFNFYNDNKGWLQLDKLGHAITAYKESYVGYYGLRNAGVKKKKALIYGGPLGLILQTPIEIFDGMYEGWGFSWGDMIANASGSALLIGQELILNDQPLKLKMSYQRSKMADIRPGYLGKNQLQSFFYDYNGHTYWFSLNLNKLVKNKCIPNWLNIAAGYSGENMFSEFHNNGAYSSYKRYRQYYFSLDVDWTKIKTRYKIMRIVLDAMMVIKMPFPTIAFDANKGLRSHLIYF